MAVAAGRIEEALLGGVVVARTGGGSTVGSTVRSPVMLDTGPPRITGTHAAVCTHGGVAQSASVLHAGPPGWLQKPALGGQSLLVPHV